MQDTIAIVFDFDDTLAPDSTSSFLESLGIEVPSFWKDDVQPMLDAGWDPVPAYLYKMIERSGELGEPITESRLAAYGSDVIPFKGVVSLFKRLRDHLSETAPHVSLEYYCISSGIGEILRHTKIAKHFTEIWACEFDYDMDGAIRFPKNIVSFTDKTRYLFHISKGLIGSENRAKPFEVNRKIAHDKLRVPLSQMIIVGDGYTDVPCFSLIRRNDGVALGVYDPVHREKWGRAWGFIQSDRVSNLAPTDYSKSGAIYHSLIMALDSIASRIELRSKSYQG